MDELIKELISLKTSAQKVIDFAEVLLEDMNCAKDEVTYTLEDVRKACTEKSRMGRTDSVKAILSKYGADRLSVLKESNYAAVMQEVEAL